LEFLQGNGWKYKEISMKMSKVAKMVGVNRRTILNWVTHKSLVAFFSAEARNEGDRELDEKDIFIINTIKDLRDNTTRDWEKIAQKIHDGYLVTDLSISAVEVDTGKTPLQQFTRTLAIAQERDLVVKQLEDVQGKLEVIEEIHKKEIRDLTTAHKAELKEEQQSKIDLMQASSERLHEATKESSERENQLHNKIGQLEAELKFLKPDD
jgi:hypothetical protein